MDMKVNSKLSITLIWLSLIWIFSYFTPLSNMVEVWYQSNTYAHGFFILPIVIYLIWEQKNKIDFGLQKNEWKWLIPLLFIQILFITVSLLGINLFSQICAYLSLTAILLSFFGFRFVLQIIFPLSYLIFAIPFGEEFVPALQDITAELSVFLLNLVNIPVYQEGLYLYIPNGAFEVAEACAGIRFLIASIALGILYAYLNYQTLWKRILFIITSCFLPILANGIRAFGIILIGHYSDMKYATGADHLIYGWFFFSFIIILLFWLGQFGRESVSKNKTKKSANKDRQINFKISLVVAISLLLILPKIYLHYVSSTQTTNTTEISQQISKIFNNTESKTALIWQPIFEDAQAQWLGNINDKPTYIAQYFNDNHEHELVSGLHRHFDIENWSLVKSEKFSFDERNYTQLSLVSVQGNKINIRYWYQVNNIQSSEQFKIKLAQLKSKLLHQFGAGYFIAVQVPENISTHDWQAMMDQFKQLDD